jgi:hypothetical protein
MKMVSIIAGLMFTASAFAAPAWNDLVGKSQYFFDAGTLPFEQSNAAGLEAYYIRPISVKGYAQVCVAGDRIFAGVVQACTKKSSDEETNGNQKCVATAPSALSIAIGTNSKPICLAYQDSNGPCKTWGTKYYNVGTTVQVRVLNKNRMDKDYPQNRNQGLVGVYTVALPSCEDTPTPAN